MRRFCSLLVAAAPSLLGCSGGSSHPLTAADRRALTGTPQAASDAPVATVGGRPIFASALALEASAANVSPRVALQSLIDAEVLTLAAIDRGLLTDPDVIEQGKAARVRRLLQTVFEAETPAARIPEEDYKKTYEKNKLSLDHDAAVEVWHLLAQVDKDRATAEQRARARARLSSLLSQAASATSDEAFAALASSPRSPGSTGSTDDVVVKAEHFTLPREQLEPAFADAAFALKRPGSTSAVVDTPYGSHIIRLVRSLPARHVPLAEAKQELEAGTLELWRRRELARYLRGLIEKTHVEVFADNLARLEASREPPTEGAQP